MMLRRAARLALLPLLAATGPVIAQTAASGEAAAPIATGAANAATDAQIRDWINAAPPPSATDDHDGVAIEKPQPLNQPLKMHGQAGVTIGSGGYRSAYVATIMPLGDNAVLGLAASDTHYGNNRSGWGWGRGGNSKTLALSLAAGDPHAPGPPDGCLLVGGRYVEPLWAAELRGPDDHCSQRHGEEITRPPRP